MAIPQELHARRLFGGRIDDNLCDVRMHGDVQVRPKSRRPEERLGGTAPSATPNRSLKKVNASFGVIARVI